MAVRYKSRPITPVDGVMWNGTNVAEVQALCPEATIEVQGTILLIPTDASLVRVYINEYVLRSVGTNKYSKLGADVFYGLYEPQ